MIKRRFSHIGVITSKYSLIFSIISICTFFTFTTKLIYTFIVLLYDLFYILAGIFTIGVMFLPDSPLTIALNNLNQFGDNLFLFTEKVMNLTPYFSGISIIVGLISLILLIQDKKFGKAKTSIILNIIAIVISTLLGITSLILGGLK